MEVLTTIFMALFRNFSDQVHPMFPELSLEGNAIFQVDNVPIHTARIIKEWHEEHSNKVEPLIWPLQSPDFIIQNLGSFVEIQELYNR